MSRVTDGTINNYPSELIENIKDCACAISEWLQKFQNALDITSTDADSNGIIKSQTAGAVSVTYDTALTTSYLLDLKNQEKIIYSVINSYLYEK